MHTKKMTTKKCRALGIYCVLRRSPFTTLANSANYTQMMRWSGGGGGRTGGATGREGGIRGGGCAAVAAAVWASYVIVLPLRCSEQGLGRRRAGQACRLLDMAAQEATLFRGSLMSRRRKETARLRRRTTFVHS